MSLGREGLREIEERKGDNISICFDESIIDEREADEK
jgi:hypothetical protein